MNEKIKIYIPWINAFLIVSILYILYFVFRENFYHPTFSQIVPVFKSPSMGLFGFSVKHAIQQFAGPTPQESFGIHYLISGAGLILLMILAPYLMATSYQNMNTSDSSQKNIVWYTGVTILLVAISSSFIGIVFATKSFITNKKSGIEINQNDALRSNLITLAFEASNKMILPQEIGGGNGSFTNFSTSNGDTRTITLDDIQTHQNMDEFQFLIQDISDSTLTIIGISSFDGEDPEFENANGSVGKKQQAFEVTPNKERIFSEIRTGIKN